MRSTPSTTPGSFTATTRRPVSAGRWLILAAVVALALVIAPAHLSTFARSGLANLGVAWPSRWLNLFGGSGQVVAAVVDIDTTLKRQHAIGAGTGIVVDAGGLVLTNNHVIDGANMISATDVGNGRTYPATLLGRDRRHDIALLQLRGATGLATAPLGDSVERHRR
jgi:S1-C subfamily serine protease